MVSRVFDEVLRQQRTEVLGSRHSLNDLMADDWAAAGDDLEKLLDLDDFDIPAVYKSSKTAPSRDTQEVDTCPLTVEPLVSNSSIPHSLPKTEIVRVNAQSREAAVPRYSADVASEGGTLVLDDPEGRFRASTTLAGQITLHLDTQRVFTGIDHQSFVDVYAKGTGEGRDEDSQDKALLTFRGNSEETPTLDEHTKRDVLLAAENSTSSHVHPGVNDTDIAVVNERRPNDVEFGFSQLMGVGETSEKEDTEMGIAPGTEPAEKSPAGSEYKLSGKRRQSLFHGQQGVGKIWSHSRETGTAAPIENRYSCSKTLCTAVEHTQVLSHRESPAQVPRSPQKGDCGKRIGQQETDFSERGNGRGLGYRIPGPAGALQENFRKRTSTGTHKTCQGPPDSVSQSDTTDFEEPPWITAMAYLQSGATDNLPRVTIANIKSVSRSSEHVPKLVAVIKAVVPNGFGDVSVVLKDPTGTISGCIHRSVLTESRYSHKIAPGAVVVLHKVAVFCPGPYAHYLNITSKNVHKLFGSEGGSLQPPAKIIDDGNLEVSSDDLERRSPHLAVSGQGVRDPPGAGNPFPEKQCVQTTGENERSIQGPKGGESVQDTRIMHSGVASGDSRFRERVSTSPLRYPKTLTAREPDGEPTHETVVAAKAKAAGWEFGEDVELLLDDNFEV